MTFVGLTWDHPRGYDALAEAARRVNADHSQPLLHWNKQPLEGFESAPIRELAAANDLLVLDHPHIGEAVVEECLIPLDELYSAEQIATWHKQSVGPSAASYRWNNKTWAVPLDVATQVMARRIDLAPEAPSSWLELIALAKRSPVALSVAGPHAILNLISMVAAEGAQVGGEGFVPDKQGEAAISILQELYALRPAGTEQLNPIGLLELMARQNTIALIPLIFGYVTYAIQGHAPYAICYSDTIRSPGGKGGVIGGTGIGFSRRCKPSPELLSHITWLMKPETQTLLLPAFGGQPSARVAWENEDVNRTWGDFYRNTIKTADCALLRPRFDGYIAFQTRASARLRQSLEIHENPTTTLAALRDLWHDARSRSRGPLEEDRG